MSNSIIKNMNFESIEQVLESIISRSNRTRRDIADDTGLSLMTVGRIIDALVESGLILKGKNVSENPGRRASMSYPDTERYFIVMNLTYDTPDISVYDILGELKKKIIRPQFDISGDLVSEINSLLMELTGELNYFMCIGVGVIMPENSDTDEFPRISAEFSMSPFAVCLSTPMTAANVYFSKNSYLPEYGIAYYAKLTPPAFGTLCIDGNCFKNEDGIIGDFSTVFTAENSADVEIEEMLKKLKHLLKYERLIIETSRDLDFSNICSNTRIITENCAEKGILSQMMTVYLRKLVNNL